MKQHLRTGLMLVIFAASTLSVRAQGNPCPGQSLAEIPDFSGVAYQIEGSFDTIYNVGDVFRFYNVLTIPYQINVDVKIEAKSNMTIEELDDNSTRPRRFQPLIDLDPDYLGNSLTGYVQFTFVFRRSSDNTIIPFSSLTFDHDNLDGHLYLPDRVVRETGWVNNPGVSTWVGPSITDQGTVEDGGYTWRKFLGDSIEHNPDYSADPTVSYQMDLGPGTVVRFRTGFEYDHRNNADTVTIRSRDYSIQLWCLDFPADIPLPVKLIGFNGTYRIPEALLSWTTEAEVNFSRFEIQRSSDGRVFESVGSVNSTGNGTGRRTTYNFSDDLSQMTGNVYYYRLRMIDIDGSSAYSQSLFIRKDGRGITTLAMYPNPIANGQQATLRMHTQTAGEVEIRVVDLGGRVFLRQRNSVFQGDNAITLNNADRLRNGVYMLQVMGQNGELQSTKFVVTK